MIVLSYQLAPALQHVYARKNLYGTAAQCGVTSRGVLSIGIIMSTQWSLQRCTLTPLV
jgi:hypothetical protein